MNKKTVEELLLEKDLESAFIAVYEDTAKLANSHQLEKEDIDGYLFIYDLAIRSGEVQYEGNNLACIELLTVNAYRFSPYYWRGRPHADYLFTLLEDKVTFKKAQKADFYFELGTYYRSISRYQKALTCFENAFALKKEEGSLYYIVLTERFLHPDKTIEIKNTSLISPRIKLALQGKGGLKIDPVEKSEEFLAVYDEVHEEAMEIIEKEGDLHLCFQMWNILTELYAKRGIFWRSPALMNPNVRFD